MNTVHLDKLERRAYRSVVGNGLTDICIGLFLLFSGLVFLTDIHLGGSVDIWIIPLVLLGPVWILIKRRVVEPRVGYMKLKSEQRTKIYRGKRMVLLLYIGASLVIFVVLSSEVSFLSGFQAIKTIMISLIFALPLAAAGYVLELRRWMLFALGTIVLVIIENALGAPFGTGMVVSGIGIMLIGLAILNSFLRAHGIGSDSQQIHG